MTILQSLDGYYQRLAARGEAELPGFSREKISFVIVLSSAGDPVDVLDIRERAGKKLVPRLLEVPAAVKRTAGVSPNRLWDKSSYVLGRTAGQGRRTAEEHAAFRTANLNLVGGSDDPGLVALRNFLEGWEAGRFDSSPFVPDMLDANLVFRLDGDPTDLHGRDAAQALLRDHGGAGEASEFCLVTGVVAPPVRLHPTVKGVQGAQSSGAALVSFNLDAFTSYGKAQGANAPTSESAAFRYGAALNRMLDRNSRNRVERLVGDATVAFWADTSDEVPEKSAQAAEDLFGYLLDPPAPAREAGMPANLEADRQEAARLRDTIDKVAAGRPEAIDPKLRPGTRFHVLGLSPNAARLSVRYWLDDEFAAFARRLGEHMGDMRIEPPPLGWGKAPSVSRLLVKTTALQEKFDNIPPLLAGEVMRAVLAGTRYPRTLLAAAIIRLRAGDDAGTGWHAAVIRGVLMRAERARTGARPDTTKEELVSLDRTRPDDPAYHLGRLFAALETAQRLALGRVNATIRDRYFGAASATPASVFPLLLRGAQNHTAKLRKERKDGWIEREIGEIVDQLPSTLPRSLKLEAQGRFAIGYYHQRQAQFAGRKELPGEIKAADAAGDETGETDDG